MLGDSPLGGERVGLIVGPPELLASYPIPQLAEADLLRWKFRPQGLHDLVERDTHRCLFLILGKCDHIDIGARGCRQVRIHPCEHRISDRVRVDLPEKCQKGRLARRAGFHLGGGIRDAQADIAAQPTPVHLITDLPRIDLREGCDVVDETLFVLGARVAFIVGGIDRLTQHLHAFGFRVIDEVCVSRRRLTRVKNNPDPRIGRGECGGQVDIGLIVRNRVDRKSNPRCEGGFVRRRIHGSMLRKHRVIGHCKLVQRQLSGLSPRGLGAVNVHPGKLRGSGLISGGELRGGHIVRPRRTRRIELLFHIQCRLVGEIDRRRRAESRAAIVQNEELISSRKRRPVESQGDRLGWDIECQIRAGGVERPAADRTHVGGVEQKVIVVAGASIV